MLKKIGKMINFPNLLLKFNISHDYFLNSHEEKQNIINNYKHLYNYKILVETGTYMGDMIFAQKEHFHKLYSIELSEELFQNAKIRFKNDKNIHLLQGDSGVCLKIVTQQLDMPAIFWLDGHYSGGITVKGEKECPVIEELKAIFESNYPHVILIDDARHFTGKNDYPTIGEINDLIKSLNIVYKLEVKKDVIRITPSKYS